MNNSEKYYGVEELIELYKTKKGRKYILFNIINQDNLSITEIVSIKEQSLNKKIEEDNELIKETIKKIKSLPRYVFLTDEREFTTQDVISREKVIELIKKRNKRQIYEDRGNVK